MTESKILFKLIKKIFNKKYFIKKYNEESDEGHFYEVDVQYLETSHEIHNNLPKTEKLITNLHDKTEYVIHLRNLKQALHHELFLKKRFGSN